MPFYHGTSRVFDRFDTGAREAGQLGRAFYFTDNEQVAENFAVFRHPPPMEVFDSEDELARFLEEHRDWTLIHTDEIRAKILASFVTPEFLPQVIEVELDLELPLALDDPPPEDLVAAAAGVASVTPGGRPRRNYGMRCSSAFTAIPSSPATTSMRCMLNS
jgi:hypothetical protein